MSAVLDDDTHRPVWSGLHWRLLVAVLAAAVLLAGGLGYYIWTQCHALAERSERAAENLVRVTAAYDTALLDDARGLLTTLAHAPWLRNQRWAECRQYFPALLSALPRYVNIGVVSARGRVLCSGLGDPEPGGTHLGDRAYFREAHTQEGMVLSEFTRGRLSNASPTLVAAQRVPGSTPASDVVLFVALNLNYLQAGAPVPDLLPGSRLWVLDRRGRVLQHLPGRDEALGTMRTPAPSPMAGGISHVGFRAADGQSWRRFTLLAGPEGDPAGISVRYEVPEAVLYAQARRALWVGLLLVFLISCLGLLAGWSLMQYASGRSLDHLRRALDRLAAQDFSVRIAGQLKGRELHAIGKQFDAMSGTVQAYQNSLAQSERSYRLLFEGSPNAMLVLSEASGRFLAVNDQALRQYGHSRAGFLLLGLVDLRVEIVRRSDDGFILRERHRRHDGTLFPVEVRYLPQSVEFAGQSAFVLVIRDLTEQEALSHDLRQHERLLAQLMDVTAEAIVGLDASGNCIFANRACALALGHDDPETLIGRSFHAMAHYQYEDGRPYPVEACPLVGALRRGEQAHAADEVLWRRDGTSFPIEYWAYPICREGEFEMGLLTFLDISDRRAQQLELIYQATHDPLTRLCNRGEILDRLHRRVAREPDRPWMLVMSNLDGFKEINEALGHDVGDRVLQETALRLRGVLGEHCLVGRVGGDEFAFVLDEDDLRVAHDQVQGLLTAIREPFVLNELPIRISSSFGIVQYPVHARDLDDLVRFADLAMRRAKQEGVGVVIFDARAGERVRDRVLLRGELRAALAHGQFLLYMQPKVRLRDAVREPFRGLVGFEALARWQHPERGLISPARFIPIIEVSDLVHPFTRWVVDQAIAFCAHLQAEMPGVGVAVNVSTRNLMDSRFPFRVREVLTRHELAPRQLEIEVTESAIMTDPAQALATLRELHKLGVRLAVDDFGTGYSSFSYLKKLPIDALKIDRSFVSGMDSDSSQQTIVRSIIQMAHTLKLSVIAEGIETPRVLRMLHDMGCDEGQGYHIGAPVASEAITARRASFMKAMVREDAP